MHPGMLLLLVVTSTLVLRSGDRIDVYGPIRDDGGRMVFRVAGGALYSIAPDEVDVRATEILEEQRRNAATPGTRKLKVSAEERDRLLAELSRSRGGQPPEPQRLLTDPPPEPSRYEREAELDDEWRWRREARAYEESVRRAEERVELLLVTAEEVETEIYNLLSLGYTPRQFSYQTTRLAMIREEIPVARLAVTQAKRQHDQFREDARRQGVLPGWLR